jgi:clan AA aspartic protease (TIGR02281 family)
MRNAHLLAVSGLSSLAVAILFLTVQPGFADDAAAKAALEAKGIRASRTGLSLAEEGELNKAVNAATALKRKIPSGSTSSDASGAEDPAAVQAQIEALTEQTAQLKQKLAQLNAAPIAFKGPALAELNQQISANESAITQLQVSSKQSGKASSSNNNTEPDAKAARDAYLQAIFEARKMADHVIGQYTELSKDPEVAAAIKSWNDAAHTSLTLKPSRGFDSAVKRLEVLEKKVPSEKIPLKQQGTGYLASVAINGDRICEMLVDSTAPSLLLPHQTAVDAGVKVNESAETTPFQTADGSEVQAHHVMLKSVRVGSFTAHNVACGVLPASSKSTKAVLGKSFLGQFKGKVDSLSGELSLVRADADGATRRHKKPAAKHTSRKSKPAQTEEPQE